jgi:iron(III) transport system substrate-binding protein
VLVPVPGLHDQVLITLYHKPYAAIFTFQPLVGGTAVLVTVLLTACGAATGPTGAGASVAGSAPRTVRLYTSVTQATVDAVVAGFTAAHPGSRVEVFRAPTGQLNARIAAERRAGGLRGDVIWATDPLSMEDYARQGLLAPWPLTGDGVPASMHTDRFAGTRVLYLVLVAHRGVEPPRSWQDLTQPRFRGQVAVPDPALAGSAFAALGYFARAPGYGMDFYRRLRANGAVQVGAVPEVVTQVAQGRYQVGITLDSEVRASVAKGSPISMVWPTPGAIALYSPIAITTVAGGTSPTGLPTEFLRYVLSRDGQQRIADTGWQPVLAGVAGPPKPAGAAEVAPDWPALFGRQRELLTEYQTIYPR